MSLAEQSAVGNIGRAALAPRLEVGTVGTERHPGARVHRAGAMLLDQHRQALLSGVGLALIAYPLSGRAAFSPPIKVVRPILSPSQQ